MIQQLFNKKGKSFSHFPLRVIFLEMNDPAPPLQAGFSVSARNFKKAVDRNRVKRLMREGYRLQKNSLQTTLKENHKSLAVFFIYTGKELPGYALVFEKMGKTLEHLEKMLD